MAEISTIIKQTMRDIEKFCLDGGKLKLRNYQMEPAKRIIESVTEHYGDFKVRRPQTSFFA
jgi:hypothetical protein